MTLFRWKIRAKIKSNVTRPRTTSSNVDAPELQESGLPVPNMKKVRSKSTAAVEIQRHIRGKFTKPNKLKF